MPIDNIAPDEREIPASLLNFNTPPAAILIEPVVSIELADKTNLEVVLPNVCPDEFDVGTIAVALIVTPVVVNEAAFTVPV